MKKTIFYFCHKLAILKKYQASRYYQTKNEHIFRFKADSFSRKGLLDSNLGFLQ